MEKSYYFAQIKINVPEGAGPDNWQQFEHELPYLFEINLHSSQEPIVTYENTWKKYGGAQVAQMGDGWFFVSPDNGPERALPKFTMQDGKPVPLPVPEKLAENDGKIRGLCTSKDYTDCVLHSDGYRKKTFGTLHTAVDAALPLHGGSIVHASCVIYKGKAILFCGPSGMGKSTQARLWAERFGTYMISSDAPAVYPAADGSGAVAYGMPWDGSDQIFTQESAPVAAVIELAQAKENRIRRMDEREAYNRLLQQGHLPLWDSEAMICEMQVLKRLAAAVPFYHLDCLPEHSAAELVERTLF